MGAPIETRRTRRLRRMAHVGALVMQLAQLHATQIAANSLRDLGHAHTPEQAVQSFFEGCGFESWEWDEFTDDQFRAGFLDWFGIEV